VHPFELIAVSSVMAQRDSLVTLRDTFTVEQVAKRLAQLDPQLHYLEYPVVDSDERLLGFVSHATILHHAHQLQEASRSVASIMRKPISVQTDDRVRSAVSLMAKTRRRSVAVVDEGGSWRGILTVADLLEAWKQGLAIETKRRRVRSLNPFARSSGA
jgi:Mg/Co/Ni transporter MgtE